MKEEKLTSLRNTLKKEAEELEGAEGEKFRPQATRVTRIEGDLPNNSLAESSTICAFHRGDKAGLKQTF